MNTETLLRRFVWLTGGLIVLAYIVFGFFLGLLFFMWRFGNCL